ncbi:hypothetical protein JW921_08495 [Candidatus Fermentibacterales bacterium]|nr:hypothetical protein [Candidatus Fermentibacterales bacterium]
MKRRTERLQLIARLLAERRVRDQSELAGAIEAMTGSAPSQSMLSRDLKSLGVVRSISSDGTYQYSLPELRPASTSMDAFRKRLACSVTGTRRSGFLVLVLTGPGEAPLVARLLDGSSMEGLLGTVAGDDTIICVTTDPGAAERLEEELRELTS